MDPKDFLQTAELLASSSRESDLRTSVSRSYYAVILFFRNYFANKLGFPQESLKTTVHTFIPECFNSSGLTEAEKTGEKIKRFKSDRHRADYKLLSKKFTENNAKDSLCLAKELIDYPIPDQVLEQAQKRAKAQRLI